jgi:Family of unknown function (DUF6328)
VAESSPKSAEDLDRELIELLNELRVVLPGVQVLFAFLLAVPFTQRFEDVTELQKHTFFAALLCTMTGSVLLIAPAVYHRIRWREHDKEAVLRTANRMALAGSVFLALAMTAVVFLITDVLYQGVITTIVVAVTAGLFFVFWFALPLSREWRERPR